jgi:murein DD-endopeptidase MepM/ murein hydrolase activator NlpD
MAAPFSEIRIVDEVSAKYENMRRSLRAKDQSVGFPKAIAAVKGLEQSVENLNRSFARFLGITGISSLLGAGLIGGIARATRAMEQFAQGGLQLRYAAKEIGITAERLRYLTDAGRALGMSQEEARGGVVNLARALENLNTEGRNAKEFKELAQGQGGEALGRKLIEIVRGPDGINRAMEYLATRTRQMDARAQTSIKNIFGQSSVAWAEAFNIKGLHDVNEANLEDLNKYSLAWVNLERSWYNTKVTVGQSLIPAFTSLLNVTTQYLNGPGRGLVQQFAEWMRSIKPEDVRAFASALGDGIKAFVQGVEKLWPILQSIDHFVRENLGGWTTLLAAIFVPAPILWLTNFSKGLRGIGQLLWVVSAIGGLAVLSPSSGAGGATPGGGGGGGATGGGGTTTLPEVTVNPGDTGNIPLPRPRPPGRRSEGGGRIQLAGLGIPTGITLPDEEGNFPGGGTTTRQEITSLRQDREITKDLAGVVESTTKKVAALNQVISNLPLSDASGAGRIAALAGAISAGGGGGGGGGGRAPRGGGGGGGGRGPRRGGPRGGDSDSVDPMGPEKTGAGETNPRRANVRHNNPGAQAWAPWVSAWEGKPARTGTGHSIASYPTPVHGAASNIRLLMSYFSRGMTINAAMRLWSDGGYGGPNRRPTPEELADPNFFIRLLKAQTVREGGGRYPMDEEQWQQAARWAITGRIPIDPKTGKPEAALPRTDPALRQQPPPTTTTTTPPTTATTTASIPTTGAYPSPITGTIWQGPGAPRRGHIHAGTDIGAPVGTPIYSMGPGTVLRSGFQGGITGGIVVVRYDNGIEAKYMHLSNWDVWRLTNGGSRIDAAGKVIALSGATGAKGISPHLHVEYRDRNGHLLKASDVHDFGPSPGYESLRGRQVVAGQPGSYAPGQKPPLPGASTGVDPSIHKVLWSNQDELDQTTGFRAGRTRHQIQLKINIRGGRNLGVRSSSENLDMKVQREKEMDPTGGGRIQSPA